MVRHDYMGCLENVEVSSCKKTVDTHVAELVGNYSWSNIYTRPVWVLSMDRVRSGVNQWADRGQVLYITNTPLRIFNIVSGRIHTLVHSIISPNPCVDLTFPT